MALKRLLVALVLWSAVVSAQGPTPPAVATGSLSSTSSVVLNVSGYASLSVQLSGTWVGTVTFEVSNDGANYQAVNMTPTNSTTTATTATANGVWTGSVGGLHFARARVSSYTSGTVVITLQSALAGGGGGGGGGGAASSVTINDPSVTTQKAAVNASGQLSITCANCSGSGASAVDNSAFTAGGTSGAPAMGFFHSTIDAVTDGSTATLAMDAKRNLFTILRDAAGNARGVNVTAGNRLTVDGSGVTQPVSQSGLWTVGVSPYLGSGATLQSAATANGNGTTLGGLDGGSSLTLFVNCASCSGGTTINFEISSDATNYTAVLAHQVGTNTLATTTTTAGITQWELPIGGFNLFRARISAYSAGTVTISAWENTASYAAHVVNANVIGTVPVSGTFWQATQPVSGTVTTSPPANASTNVAQLAGTATSVNSGVKDAGTLRVVLATDQPALTNKLLVTPDSVALPANQSVNVNQFGGSAVATGTGASGAGVPRVTVANDSNVLATQSGTWTVQPGNTANTTAWKVDGSAVTQPVSGTITANAGTGTFAVSGPLTDTQLRATAVPVSGTVTANQGGAPWTEVGNKTNNNAAPGATNVGTLAAVANAGAPSYTEGNQVSLSTDLAGALRVSGASGGGVAQTQVRGATNTWTDVGTFPGNANLPTQDANLYALLAQLLALEQRQAGYLKGTLGASVGSVGDALKVYPTIPQDPCFGANKGNVAISQTAATKLVSGQPGQRIYVCYARVVAGVAEIPSFTEGTGAACATGAAAVSGSTTAANGESYAANGGFSAGTGAGTVMLTTKPGNDLCLAQSTSSRLAGNLVFVFAP